MSMTDEFRALHTSGTFLMPNPWDPGSARYLQWRGVPAIATTSSGLAAALGRTDQTVTRDELVGHVDLLVRTVNIPINVDSERCYSDDLAGVAETVRILADVGAAGCSIEDYNPATAAIDSVELATERVAAAAQEAARHGLVLTARTENYLYGITDLDDTIARLRSFHEAGAEVVYAAGLTDLDLIKQVVSAVDAPVNVLAMPTGPTIAELATVDVRRVSTGGALAWAALGGLRDAVDELLDTGARTYTAKSLSVSDRSAAFGR
jgi:2-methylisocitrate lyase-like PEP mutase family enzyme